MCDGMSDLLEHLYEQVIAAKQADPAVSRTAKLLRAGRPKMAKKLAEEAIEVVIDAMNGERDAVVRESADLLYNLIVLWVSADVKPQDVWDEMERGASACSAWPRRCPRNSVTGSSPSPTAAARWCCWTAGAAASGADCRTPVRPIVDRALAAPLSTRHASQTLRLVRRRGRPALCDLADGPGLVRRELVLSDPARHHADPDVARAAGPGLVLRSCLHPDLGRRRRARLLHRRRRSTIRSGSG